MEYRRDTDVKPMSRNGLQIPQNKAFTFGGVRRNTDQARAPLTTRHAASRRPVM
jgi:hypothetical protein